MIPTKLGNSFGKIEIILCWYATGYLTLVSILIMAIEVAPLQVPIQYINQSTL